MNDLKGITFTVIKALLVMFGGCLLLFLFIEEFGLRSPAEEKKTITQKIAGRPHRSSRRHVVRDLEGARYNFSYMVKLVEACKALKDRHINAVGSGDVTKIDYDAVRVLLNALQHERSKFNSYIWELKGYSRAPLPRKRVRSFQYYLQVIEDCIRDMELLYAEAKQQRKQVEAEQAS